MADVKNATLKYFINEIYTGVAGYNVKPAPITVHRITKDWSEGSVDWTKGWNKAGGDFENTAIATYNYSNQYKGWVDFDVTEIVKKFVDKTLDNYGFMIGIMGDSDNGTTSLYQHDTYIRSKEHSDQSEWPVIVVDVGGTAIGDELKPVGTGSLFNSINLVGGQLIIDSKYKGLISVNVTNVKGVAIYNSNSISLREGLNRFKAGKTKNASGVYFAVIEFGNSMKSTVKLIAK